MKRDPTEVFERIIRPEQGDLSEEHARYILSLTFAESDKKRADVLSYKAQEGKLTTEELHELETLLAINSFLIVPKSKARLPVRDPQWPA
jgi:hypothetical protein